MSLYSFCEKMRNEAMILFQIHATAIGSYDGEKTWGTYACLDSDIDRGFVVIVRFG